LFHIHLICEAVKQSLILFNRIENLSPDFIKQLLC
jgi:hypothetical protein